jgi:hypothetical protein
MRDLNLFPEALIENTVAFFHKANIVNLRNKKEVVRQVNLPNGMCMVCSNYDHLAICEWRKDMDNSNCYNVFIDLKTKGGARLVFDRDVIGRSIIPRYERYSMVSNLVMGRYRLSQSRRRFLPPAC